MLASFPPLELDGIVFVEKKWYYAHSLVYTYLS